MRISICTRASGAHVRHATLRGSLLATFSISISPNMLLISGALMALHDHHPSLFDMLTQTDFFLSLVTAKHPKITLKCGDGKQICWATQIKGNPQHPVNH